MKAYAKVAGKDWTYYVNRTEINIGRPPDGAARKAGEVGMQSSPPLNPQEASGFADVQVDLGPSKLVSRLHACVYFEEEHWNVSVNGRNGVRVNDKALRKGQKCQLQSGDVLEIAGTEMIFVTAEAPAQIHSQYQARLMAKNTKTVTPKISNPPSHAHPEPPSKHMGAPVTHGAPLSKAASISQTMIAPAPPHVARPTTPVQSPSNGFMPSQATKKSPGFGRGIMMQSNEPFDFSSDAVKDIKPTYSYATLIAQAILSTEEEMLTLAGIYGWITDHFSYYRHAPTGWQVR